jgi:RNA polymerase sigma factor (sigma-70 family)
VIQGTVLKRDVAAPADLVDFCRDQQSRLIGMLTLYCSNRDVAEELTQEVLARACLNWSKVRRMALPEAWTYRVAINLANSYFRRRRAEHRAKRKWQGRSHDDGDVDHADAVAVRQAVARLPRRQKTTLVLRYFSDLSVSHVAELMECPESTVKTLTRRAIATLRTQLGPGYLSEVTHDA